MGNIFCPPNNFDSRDTTSKNPSYCQKTQILKETVLTDYKVSIQSGKLQHQNTECILVLQDKNLSFSGYLEKQIKSRGGMELEEECKEHIQQHGYLEQGKFCKTHGGNLGPEYVLHLNMPYISNNINSYEKAYIFDIIQQILGYCFNDLQLSSISIPILIKQSSSFQYLSQEIQQQKKQKPSRNNKRQKTTKKTLNLKDTERYNIIACIILQSVKKFIENQIENSNISNFMSEKSSMSESEFNDENFSESSSQRSSSVRPKAKTTDSRQLHYASSFMGQMTDHLKEINIVNYDECISQIFEEEFQDVFIHHAPINLRKSIIGHYHQQNSKKRKDENDVKKIIKNRQTNLTTSTKETNNNNDKNYSAYPQFENADQNVYENEEFQFQFSNESGQENGNQTYYKNNTHSSNNISEIFDMTPKGVQIKSKQFQLNKTKTVHFNNDIDNYSNQLSY